MLNKAEYVVCLQQWTLFRFLAKGGGFQAPWPTCYGPTWYLAYNATMTKKTEKYKYDMNFSWVFPDILVFGKFFPEMMSDFYE